MRIDTSMVIQSVLDSGEDLLWSGQPRQGKSTGDEVRADSTRPAGLQPDPRCSGRGDQEILIFAV